MAHPTSLRLSDSLKARLEKRSTYTLHTPSALAVLLIDEGLRMGEHPGVVFHDSPTHGRVAALRGGPDVAEVVDIMVGLDSQGEERVTETATWFALDPSQVRIAMGYYAVFRAEIEGEVAIRHREGEEMQRRWKAEQALLG